jgi:hypothetical protein
MDLISSIVIGFATALPNLSRALFKDEAHQVFCNQSRILLKYSGNVCSICSFLHYDP